MDKLQHQGGFIVMTDKSRLKRIADLFGVGKKIYKKANCNADSLYAFHNPCS